MPEADDGRGGLHARIGIVASSANDRVEVCVVGAGLAGLSCARFLALRGVDVRVLERAESVGGRVRTDAVDGFLLDRGFQVLLTALPEAFHQLDFRGLDLRRFDPGVVLQRGGRRYRVGHPLRRPEWLVSTLTAPIGTLGDRVRLAALGLDLLRTTPREILRRPDASTIEWLRGRGFSDRIIDRFWRPLFAGIQLDPDLEVSSRRFQLVLSTMLEGDVALPAAGMGSIPAQLAAALPPGAVELGAEVVAVTDDGVRLADGRSVSARAVVIATEGPAAARLAGVRDPGSRAVTTVFFGADAPPTPDRTVILDSDRSGPATNVAIVSNVAPSYAPPGRALVVAEVPGIASDGVAPDVRRQMRGWFGREVDGWEVLRTVPIVHAHPDQRAGFAPKQAVRLGPGRYVCGDHRDTASIQGALFSGRRTAAAILTDRT